MPTIRDTPHPYYGADGDLVEFETLDELIENTNGCDENMNFVYRWDWDIPDPSDYEDEPEEMPGETLALFVVLQRKSRFVNWVAPVTADDEDKVREFLSSDRILGALRRTWAPLLDVPPTPSFVSAERKYGYRTPDDRVYPVTMAITQAHVGFITAKDYAAKRAKETGGVVVTRTVTTSASPWAVVEEETP